MPAVSNSSPLILYGAIGRLELLRDLFGQVVIPGAVEAEVVRAGFDRPGASAVQAAEWLDRRTVADNILTQRGLLHLDRGEAEAIALALDLAGEVLLLLNDKSARQEAKRRGLALVGSVGIVVLAKRAGLVTQGRPLLDELCAAGLYVSPAIYHQALLEAGE